MKWSLHIYGKDIKLRGTFIYMACMYIFGRVFLKLSSLHDFLEKNIHMCMFERVYNTSYNMCITIVQKLLLERKEKCWFYKKKELSRATSNKITERLQ